MDSLLKIKQGSRSEFLQLSADAAVKLALNHMPGAVIGDYSDSPRSGITLKQCSRITPLEMAARSDAAKAGFRFLQKMSGEIRNPNLRRVINVILHHPVPQFMVRYQSAKARGFLCGQLAAEGLLAPGVTAERLFPPLNNSVQSPQPLMSAPGSSYFSHDSYPGGLVIHTALNLCSSLGLYEGYCQVFGLKLKRDIVIAAQILHDLAKAWVFQWQDNHGLLPEYEIAGTGAHHVLGVAESIYRGLPAEIVIAQACAHENIRTLEDEAKVVNYLKAATIISGRNPDKAGLLTPCGTALKLRRKIEFMITHLGDHDWTVNMRTANWTISFLQKMACDDYGMTEAELTSLRFHVFRNYVLSQATMTGMYHNYISAGEKGVRSAVHNLVAPV